MPWRDAVIEREKNAILNCARCANCVQDPRGPLCLKWSALRETTYFIPKGFSGVRNDAPFCQFFETKPERRP